MSTVSMVVYGNGEVFHEIFQAVANMAGDKAYLRIIHTTILFGAFWAASIAVFRHQYMFTAKWTLSFLLVYHTLFVPSVSLVIFDRVNNNAAYKVDHVPMLLGVMASTTSLVGDGLTQLFEKHFTPPDYLPYSQTGMVMASRMMTMSHQFEVRDETLRQNLEYFMQQCVFYDVLLGKYSLNELMHQKDAWGFVKRQGSPNRGIIYQEGMDRSAMGTEPYHGHYDSRYMSCRDAAEQLDKDWQATLPRDFLYYAHKLFPAVGMQRHQSLRSVHQLERWLPQSYQYLVGTSQNAIKLVQQNMFGNMMLDSLGAWGARVGANTVATQYAFAKAQLQKRLTYHTMGAMAGHWLPLMKNAFEAILYGAFMIVALLVVTPLGNFILKNYLYSLLWLQLWAPLYAILNLIISWRAAGSSYAMAAGGVTLSNQNGLAVLNSDFVAVAGYLSISVPFISILLVRGLASGFVQLAQYMGGISQGAATSGAVDAATGNISLGNTSIGNQQAMNLMRNQFNNSARWSGGGITTEARDGAYLTMTPDGGKVLEASSAISNYGIGIHLGKGFHQVLSQQAESAHTAGLNSAKSASSEFSSGLQKLYEFAQHSGHTGTGTFTREQIANQDFRDAAQNVLQTMQSYEHAHNDTHQNTLRLFGSIAAGGHKGGLLSKIPVVGKNIELGGGYGHEKQSMKLYNEAQRIADENHFSESIEKIRHYAEGSQFHDSDEHGNRLLDSLGSHFQQGARYRDEATSHFEKSESYHKADSWSQDHGMSIDQNYSQEFFDWMSRQEPLWGGESLGVNQAKDILLHHPEQAQMYAEQYIRETVPSLVDHVTHEAAALGRVASAHQSNMKHIEDQREAVLDQHEINKQSIYDAHGAENIGQYRTAQEYAPDAQKDLVSEKLNSQKESIAKAGMHTQKRVLHKQGKHTKGRHKEEV